MWHELQNWAFYRDPELMVRVQSDYAGREATFFDPVITSKSWWVTNQYTVSTTGQLDLYINVRRTGAILLMNT